MMLGKPTPMPGAKILLKEIAESSRAAKVKFILLTVRTRGTRKPLGVMRPATLSSGPCSFVSLPIGAELIVFATLLRIAQHLVGLVDLFKFCVRRCLVLSHVGVMDARELAKRFLDLIRGRVARDSQLSVVIFEIDRHGKGAGTKASPQ